MEGRMINTGISESKGVAQLSPESLALFCLLIPHFNSHGKMRGDVGYIKGLVCPRIKWLTPIKIAACLREISKFTKVKFFQHDGLPYIQSINWKLHQKLREDRLGQDLLPEYSRTTPGVLPQKLSKEKGRQVGEEPSQDSLSPEEQREFLGDPNALPPCKTFEGSSVVDPWAEGEAALERLQQRKLRPEE